MCGQGLRIQVHKLKSNNVINKPIREESNITYQCSTRFCNTQDPSSSILCDECLSRKFESTTMISDLPQEQKQEKSSISSRSSNLSWHNPEPKSMKIDPIESDPTEWRCEECSYDQNLIDNETCVVCEYGHRPQQTKSSSTKTSERSSTFKTDDQLKKQGNILLRSLLSDRLS